MKNKELIREEALEQNLAFQIRLHDYLHMFQIALEIKGNIYKPTNALGQAPTATSA
jgi:hypothetical protein